MAFTLLDFHPSFTRSIPVLVNYERHVPKRVNDVQSVHLEREGEQTSA